MSYESKPFDLMAQTTIPSPRCVVGSAGCSRKDAQVCFSTAAIGFPTGAVLLVTLQVYSGA